MPRPPRLHVPGGSYHVTLRGNHREALFASAADRTRLDEIVAEDIERYSARLHAFCWMTNHLHAVIQIGDRPLGDVVGSIAMRYSRYRHKALNTVGHLFERRHGAKLIEVTAYFQAVVRYIHMNPVKASMVADPAEYPWSSHRAYLGLQSIPWLTLDLGLSMFGRDRAEARRAYAQALARGDRDDDLDVDLEKGGHPDDPRVLGGDDFVANLTAPVAVPSSRVTLEELAADIAASRGVTVDLLRSRSSRRSLTPIRIELLEAALAGRVATLTEVSRFLGRDPSTLSKLRRRKVQ